MYHTTQSDSSETQFSFVCCSLIPCYAGFPTMKLTVRIAGKTSNKLDVLLADINELKIC